MDKQEESIKLHLSASKILSFLINDMLDYAQLSAGQFRKLIKQFDLVSSIDDIVRIMAFKAEELDLTINIDLSSLVPNRQG